jgi:MATE family multidrug resistance protein
VSVFTNQAEIAEQMGFAWPVLQVFVIFDCTQGVAASVVRGTGQQKIGQWITLSAYWVFGIPIALLSVFYFDSGIAGLWYGPTFAVLYNTICYMYLIQMIDWQGLISANRIRRAKESAKTEEI